VGLLFADGGGLREPSGELQSAAVGRRRTADIAPRCRNIIAYFFGYAILYFATKLAK